MGVSGVLGMKNKVLGGWGVGKVGDFEGFTLIAEGFWVK